MSLPWARLDANIATNDKILDLLSCDSPHVWQAAFSYLSSIGWSVGHATDGKVPRASLPFIHGTKETAGLLCDVRLWLPRNGYWQIKNFEKYQQTTIETAKVSTERAKAGSKGGCRKNHGPECWSDLKGCSA